MNGLVDDAKFDDFRAKRAEEAAIRGATAGRQLWPAARDLLDCGRDL